MAKVPYLEFHQYGSEGPDDRLLMFAAPAKDLAKWAGIPRKGWRIRMLYQRWMTAKREAELRTFWDTAANPAAASGEKYILGPNAITIAIVGEPKTNNGLIELEHEPAINLLESKPVNLSRLASLVKPQIVGRLSEAQRVVFQDFSQKPFDEMPDVSHDYVLEFAMQLEQMENDAQWFLDENAIEDVDADQLITALEALSRPALVVDGQHRLLGAADAKATVHLPVVAVPRCDWTEQIYQFVVINEKAQKVESSLLTDIFGSSLTRDEQVRVRKRLERASVDVEARIAAVIANRDDASPFKNMIAVKLQGVPPPGVNPYITDNTIRLLIDGATRSSIGWRSGEEFYKHYVSPTFPNQEDWVGWTAGKWRPYWFAFWATVRDYYNEQAKLLNPECVLWSATAQTNLTKGVALRLFQRLFMEKAVERIKLIEKNRKLLVEELGEEIAEDRIRKRIAQYAIPTTPEAFAADLKSWFLDKGVPVRVFMKPWVNSLDDADGQDKLYRELCEAYDLVSEGKVYRAQNKDVFAVDDGQNGAV